MNRLQKSFDVIFILSDKVVVHELSAALCTAVTGETTVSTAPEVHPAGRE